MARGQYLNSHITNVTPKEVALQTEHWNFGIKQIIIMVVTAKLIKRLAYAKNHHNTLQVAIHLTLTNLEVSCYIYRRNRPERLSPRSANYSVTESIAQATNHTPHCHLGILGSFCELDSRI